MSLFELCECIKSGREIEFEYEDKQYFLAPLYLDNNFTGKYYIYSTEVEKNIFIGILNEIMKFDFGKNVSFEENIDLFVFKYIL